MSGVASGLDSRLGACRPYGRGSRSMAILLAAVLAGCGDAGPGPWVEEEGYRWRELRPGGRGGFEQIAAPRRGIDFVYDVPEDERYENRVRVEGAGVAIGDVDGDGLADLFFAGFGVESRLYLNRGDWRFDDSTDRAGVALEGVLVRGAALVDVDGDRDLDLVVAVHGAANRLLRNDGTGVFAEDPRAGFRVLRGSASPALADIDADGDLDLYVTNYKTRQADDLLSDEVRAGLDALRPGPDGSVDVPSPLSEHYRVEFDGRFMRWWELGEVDELYLNDGAGRFVEADPYERFRGRDPAAAADSLRDWGLAARFADWDGDGDQDLYVANDFNSHDGIWENRGDGIFEAVPALALRSTSLSSMAVDMGDVDRDGLLDIVTTDMLARDPVDRLRQVPSFSTSAEPPGTVETRLQLNRNALHLNRGDRTFAEVAHAAGIAASDWTWGALFLDADLDGYEDLLVTTGHVWDQLDGDATERLMRAPPGTTDWRRHLASFPALRQENVAYRGTPGARFVDVTDAWSWTAGPDISHGIAAGDLDADGDLDVVVTRLSDPPLLMRNDSPAPRVLIRLEGAAPNTAAVGARITADGHPAGPQIDEVAAGGSYLSSSEPAVVFAAPVDGALRVTVDWPGGTRSVLAAAVANREYVIRHPGRAGAASPVEDGPAETTVALFVDVSETLSHRHVETAFDDRLRQPLLPVSLDRLGPGVGWVDVEGDGFADLIAGTGRGGSPVVIPNDAGTLGPPRALSPALTFDVTAILPHIAGDGGLEIVVGASNYEAPDQRAAVAQPSVVAIRPRQSGATPRLVLEGAPSTTGPLAQADVDGDGDLDVFVGGRAIPGGVPIAADSRVLINEDGDLRYSAGWSVPFSGVGLVSGAVFTDLDADGDPDLALALDWGPPRLYRNESGGFAEITGEVGLTALVGRWNGVTAGDFDGDGSPDLVLTGWGDNTERPPAYTVFHGDIDRNGSYDLLEAVRGETGWRALRRRDEVEAGIPALRDVTFARYAETPLEQLLGPALDTTRRVDVIEMRHLVLLNRGGTFDPRPLPAEAQRAPAFGVAVADFDGDGREDLVLAQNFYDGRPGVPRYDAGRALLLLGDGSGGFDAQSAIESGIAVYGDARAVSAADFDHDGRVDVAFGVNGSSTRLFRNERGRPGLRVRLDGPPGNSRAVGAAVSLIYADGSSGPLRELHSGAGYWSRDETTPTLGLRSDPASVRVRWPGGETTQVEVAPDARAITVVAPG
ncbi:MAG: VCBS repeat-containing protein [Gemmatimonadota bacterium]|nr:VCBS repeat-containing protein [Gemmatimonadota bacterium]